MGFLATAGCSCCLGTDDGGGGAADIEPRPANLGGDSTCGRSGLLPSSCWPSRSVEKALNIFYEMASKIRIPKGKDITSPIKRDLTEAAALDLSKLPGSSSPENPFVKLDSSIRSIEGKNCPPSQLDRPSVNFQWPSPKTPDPYSGSENSPDSKLTSPGTFSAVATEILAKSQFSPQPGFGFSSPKPTSATFAKTPSTPRFGSPSVSGHVDSDRPSNFPSSAGPSSVVKTLSFTESFGSKLPAPALQPNFPFPGLDSLIHHSSDSVFGRLAMAVLLEQRGSEMDDLMRDFLVAAVHDMQELRSHVARLGVSDLAVPAADLHQRLSQLETTQAELNDRLEGVLTTSMCTSFGVEMHDKSLWTLSDQIKQLAEAQRRARAQGAQLEAKAEEFKTQFEKLSSSAALACKIAEGTNERYLKDFASLRTSVEELQKAPPVPSLPKPISSHVRESPSGGGSSRHTPPQPQPQLQPFQPALIDPFTVVIKGQRNLDISDVERAAESRGKILRTMVHRTRDQTTVFLKLADAFLAQQLIGKPREWLPHGLSTEACEIRPRR